MSKTSNLSKKTNNVDLVSFKDFFHQSVLKGLVKVHQENEIWVFFKDKNLKEKDTFENYNKALKQY